MKTKKVWQYRGHQKYHFWRNPFSRYFNLMIELQIGWEKHSKNEISIYLGFCGFHLTLFFVRKVKR